MSYRAITSAGCVVLVALAVAFALHQPWYVGIPALALVLAVALVHWSKDPLDWSDDPGSEYESLSEKRAREEQGR